MWMWSTLSSCRSKNVDLRPYADEIREEIDAFCRLTFTRDELAYLKTIRYLKPSFVDSLREATPEPCRCEITTTDEFRLTIKRALGADDLV